MSTGEITVKMNMKAVKRIEVLFGIDVSTIKGSENFFNLAVVTLLAMGEEVKAGKIIVSMNPKAVGGFKGKKFVFPNPGKTIRKVKK